MSGNGNRIGSSATRVRGKRGNRPRLQTALYAMNQPSKTTDPASGRLADFPAGTPVCVKQTMRRRPRATRHGLRVVWDRDIEAGIVGVIDRWEELPTGASHAHGKNQKLWLRRLILRKVDGELVSLVVDAGTHIAKLETRN